MGKIVVILIVISSTFFSLGTTLTVSNTNDSGLGSLRQTILDASSLDTILFDPSLLLSGSNNINLLSEISWNDKAITIIGLYNSTDTLYLSGMNANRIFNVNLNLAPVGERFLNLDSLVFVNGYSYNENGGAVKIIESDSIYIKNCVFLNNSAYYGGGLYSNSENSNSIVIIQNSRFERNNRGGIYSISNNNSSIVHAENSMFYNNESLFGGGICSISKDSTSVVNLLNVEMSNNFASSQGGGLFTKSGNYSNGFASIVNCIFNQNSATDGGAIYSYMSNLEVESSLVTDNSVSWQGGGIFNKGDLAINKSTVAANSCANMGGGIYILGDTEVTNSTFSGNKSDALGGAIYSVGTTKVEKSTITNNEAYRGAGVHCGFYTFRNKIFIIHSTIAKNIGTIGGGISTYEDYELNVKSSIIAFNGNIGMMDVGNGQSGGGAINIISYGSNIFDTSPLGAILSDQKLATESQVDLGPLQYNGGPTATIQPSSISIAVDKGDPFDFSDAQNGAITGVRRDVGAAESGILNAFEVQNSIEKLAIYPNPTIDKIQLSSIEKVVKIEVYNLQGKMLFKEENNFDEVDLSPFKSGVYFVRIFDSETNYVNYKVIKE